MTRYQGIEDIFELITQLEIPKESIISELDRIDSISYSDETKFIIESAFKKYLN